MAEEEVKVIWTEKAEKQLFKILRYWTDRNKSNSYALKLLDAVDDRLSFIVQNPSASIATTFGNNRKCSLGNYSILYKEVSGSIIITAFWDNRQDPGKLKKQLS